MDSIPDFESKFFDIRKYPPKKGQCLARFTAVAHFVDDWVKRNIINLILMNPIGAKSAQKVLRNMCGALEEYSIRVPLEMAKDLITMSEDEVAAKEYRMIIQYSYWTERVNVPTDDPHWSVIEMLNTDDIDDKIKFTYTIPD